jgi:hypothetical protein
MSAPSVRVSLQPAAPSGGARDLADTLRAALAGAEAAKLLAASLRLFEGGGRHVLSATAQRAVREVAERGASRALAIAAGPVLESAAALGAPTLVAAAGRELVKGASSEAVRAAGAEVARAAGAEVARAAGKQVARAAGGQLARAAGAQVLRGAGKAAGVGFLLDGAIAGFEAVVAVRNGSSDRASAVKHVAREATTGALATGAGVLLGAGLVALTGGVATPVVFAVGAVGSLAAKQVLRRVVSRGRAPLTPRPAPTPA